jgi:hypothetical protein
MEGSLEGGDEPIVLRDGNRHRSFCGGTFRLITEC